MSSVLGAAAIPAVIGVAAGLALAAAVGAIFWRRCSPAELERRRRQKVNSRGKTAGAIVVDLREDELVYSYTVGGAHYTASQDVSGVRHRLPAGSWGLLGPATVKYDPANPANSILVSEEWSGLRGAAM